MITPVNKAFIRFQCMPLLNAINLYFVSNTQSYEDAAAVAGRVCIFQWFPQSQFVASVHVYSTVIPMIHDDSLSEEYYN